MNTKRTVIIISILTTVLCLLLLGCKSENNIKEYSSTTALVGTTAMSLVSEDNTNDGSGFEEDESCENNDNKTGGLSIKTTGNSTAKVNDFDDSQSEYSTGTNYVSSTTKSHDYPSTDNSQSEVKKTQTTTELTKTTLPPKAAEQNGEWGTPIEN